MPRPLAILAALALAACDEVTPPPGELIGTFQFVAALAESDDLEAGGDRCELPESPPAMRFDAVLSYEPTPLPDGSRRVWVQVVGQPGAPREGRLEGTRFVVRAPPDPERVPRSLETCRYDDDGDGLPDRTRCTLGFAEFLEGDLLAQVPPGCSEGDRSSCCTEQALADCGGACLLPDPTNLSGVGGVCGTVVEDVAPEPAEDTCLCTGSGGSIGPARPCTIVYRLAGVPS